MNPSNLKNLLNVMIPAREPILIVGAPGIGKTECVQQACLELGVDLMIGHPVTKERIDYAGLPGIVDGQAEFLPYGDLRRMMAADRPLCVLMDDLGQSDVDVQKPLMQLIQQRTIGEHAISDHVGFIAATNDTTHRSAVAGLIEPLKSRFASIVHCTVSPEQWISDWLIGRSGLPARTMELGAGFVAARPNLLSA